MNQIKEVTKKLDEIPSDLKGLDSLIDIHFKSFTECLFTWMNCYHYKDLVRVDEHLGDGRERGRMWLIKTIRKNLKDMNKHFNRECPYIKFRFQLSGYVNWLKSKRDTNSFISFRSSSDIFSPDEIIETLGGEYSDDCLGVGERN